MYRKVFDFFGTYYQLDKNKRVEKLQKNMLPVQSA